MICEDGRERGRKTERNIEIPYAEIKAMRNHSAKWLRRNNQQRYRVKENHKMLKGQPRFQMQKAIFFITEPLFNGEVLVPITPLMVPNVRPYYWISNYGRVYNAYTEKFMSLALDSKGYYYVALSTVRDGGCYKLPCRVHRLVLLGFAYYPGCETMLGNHKDGIKTNNFIGNLEWATYSENTIHAYNTGLNPNPKGEDRAGSTITNEQATIICEMLANGIKHKQIAEDVGVSEYIVQAISAKKSWTWLSCNYAFPIRKHTKQS